jgi:hypothetical protein
MPGPDAHLTAGSEATPVELVASVLLAASATPASSVALGAPIAVGWATVELDRAAGELAAAFDIGVDRFRPGPRSALLGCVCLIAVGILPGSASLVVLEPDTEGRLAASLARLGEGPTVTWLQTADVSTALGALRAAGIVLSAERDGPLGPERLLVDGPVHGPHRLLVGASAGTIGR